MPDKYQDKYRIPSARLKGYDYGQNGAYFITICTKNRIHYFGEIEESRNDPFLQMSPMGIVAYDYWQKIPEHFPFVFLDEYVLMPNHIHGIVIISKSNQQQQIDYFNKFGPQSGNLSSIIRGYKAGVKTFATTNKIEFLWQPRFYDRIIRDEDEMKRIRRYIISNPANWDKDRNNKPDLFM